MRPVPRYAPPAMRSGWLFSCRVSRWFPISDSSRRAAYMDAAERGQGASFFNSLGTASKTRTQVPRRPALICSSHSMISSERYLLRPIRGPYHAIARSCSRVFAASSGTALPIRISVPATWQPKPGFRYATSRSSSRHMELPAANSYTRFVWITLHSSCSAGRC
jgi:hypothetical protein